MSYCTQSDLVQRFGLKELIQLTDLLQLGAPDAATVAQACADASAQIDGYLAGRYALPLASTPPNLTRIACDIARYRLYENQPTETVATRYEAAVKYLEQIALGRIALPPSVSGAAVASEAGLPAFGGAEPVFGREAL